MPLTNIHPDQHGTKVGYQSYKCRCDLCRAAEGAYRRALSSDPGEGRWHVVTFKGGEILPGGRGGNARTDFHVVDERGRTARVFPHIGDTSARVKAYAHARRLNRAERMQA